MIRSVGEPPPRPVAQQGCRDHHLKPTGFRSLATRRNAFCAFRDDPCFLENALQPFRVRVVVTDDQDSSPIRHFQCQARTGLAFPGHFSSSCQKNHPPHPSFLCSRARPNPDLSPWLSRDSSHRLGASLVQAAADRAGPWICCGWAETVTQSSPKKRLEASEATWVISKELNFSNFSLARISAIVLRTIFSSSIPKTVALISPVRQKKVHPASRISRSNPHLSRALANLQPGTLHSLSNRTASVKSVSF